MKFGKKFWKVLGRIGLVIGILVAIYTIIPKKKWDKINNSYITKFESYNVPDTVLFEMFYEVSLENEERINSKIWNNYASTILSIYEESSPKSILRLNDTIEGAITGNNRRIDLTLRQQVAGQDILIVFKLYPWKSKITKSELFSFKLLIEDVGASKGVIITNNDVDSPQIDFAKRNLISLCTLKDSESKRWDEEVNIPVYWIQIIPKFIVKSNIAFEANDKIHKDLTRWNYSYNYGKETFTLLDYLNYKWVNNQIPHETDSLHVLYLEDKDLKLQVNKDDWREVSGFTVYYTTDENYWLRYFKPNKYGIIEDYITHNIEFSEIDLKLEKFSFEDTTEWIRLNEGDLDFRRLEGLSIVATASAKLFNSENMTSGDMRIMKSD